MHNYCDDAVIDELLLESAAGDYMELAEHDVGITRVDAVLLMVERWMPYYDIEKLIVGLQKYKANEASEL